MSLEAFTPERKIFIPKCIRENKTEIAHLSGEAKEISTQIRHLAPETLISFVLDPSSPRFNEIHWVLIFQGVCDGSHQITPERKEQIIAISSLMQKTLPPCRTVGNTSQIIRSLGHVRIQESNTEEWLLRSLETNLPRAKEKELFMLFQGAHNVFSLPNLHKLLTMAKQVMPEKRFKFFQPNLLTAVMASCSQANFYSVWTLQILEHIENTLPKFKTTELLFLMRTLNEIFVPLRSRFFHKVEEAILSKNISNDTFLTFLHHFAKNGHFPTSFEPRLQALAKSSLLFKENIFHSLALLGKQGIKEEFLELLASLEANETEEETASIKLLEIAAILFDENESLPPFLKTIARRAVAIFPTLYLDLKYKLYETLIALGWKDLWNEDDNNRRLPHGSHQHFSSPFERGIGEELEKWLDNHPTLSFLKMHPGYDVGTRFVDFMIEDPQGRKQNRIIEIDGYFHRRRDYPELLRGAAILRNKMLKNLGYEVKIYYTTKDRASCLKEIQKDLEKMYE